MLSIWALEWTSLLPGGHQGRARGLPGGGGGQVDPQQVGHHRPALAVPRLRGRQGQTGSLPGLEITVSQLRTSGPEFRIT